MWDNHLILFYKFSFRSGYWIVYILELQDKESEGKIWKKKKEKKNNSILLNCKKATSS